MNHSWELRQDDRRAHEWLCSLVATSSSNQPFAKRQGWPGHHLPQKLPQERERARETKKTKIANKDTRFLAVVQMRVKDGFENRYELAKQVPLPSGSKLHRREKLGEENDGHQ